MMGMDVDPHDNGLGGMPLKGTHETSRSIRNSIDDMHLAIDLAKEFSDKIKALHPWAEIHIKYLIMKGNFL